MSRVFCYEPDFSKQLNQIPFYEIHSEYIPFVGAEYKKYRILHIGESHYIGQKSDSPVDKYSIQFFQDNWWESHCDELANEFGTWYNTNDVFGRYMGEYKSSAYSIFNNVAKVFSDVVLGKELEHIINSEAKQLYRYFAFMNFYQMPSLYEGMGLWPAMKKSAKKLGDVQLAHDAWDVMAQKSVEVVDEVIEALEPRAVLITSCSAGRAYKDGGGKFANDERVIFTSHPMCAFTWKKKLKVLDGKTGKEVAEERLREIYQK